ncbi:MAG: BatD family protein, partial [Myxococcales bacterium]|nr:BatD family protein [Myxococcales bacterium]
MRDARATRPRRRAGAAIGALGVLLGVSLGAPLSQAAAQIRITAVMTTDRSEVALGDLFELQVRVETAGAEAERIDLPDLSAFEIVRRSISQPMQLQLGFGRNTRVVQASTVHRLLLRPRSPGTHALEPTRVYVGGQKYESNALTIRVLGDSQSAGAPGHPSLPGAEPSPPGDPQEGPASDATAILDGAAFDREAFIRTVVDKPEPYVGEQVTITVYLYTRLPIRAAPTVTREPTAEGFWVQDLLPRERSLEPREQIVGGIPFRVYVMRRFAAFPLHEGTLSIGAPEMQITTGSVFDIFQPATSLHRRGVPLSLSARPLPPPHGASAVTGRYELSARVDRDEIRVGDAFTLTLTIQGSGNIRDLRPSLPAMSGLRALEPRIEDRVDHADDLVGGTRTMEWIVVADEPGTHTIPSIGAQAFDPSRGVYAPAMSDPLQITVVGNAIAPPLPRPDAEGDPQGEAGVDQPALVFGPIRPRSVLRRAAPLHSSRPWYPWGLALPPLIYLGLGLGRWGRRRAESRAEAGAPRRALKAAQRRLREATTHLQASNPRAFYAEIAQALQAVLGARLGESVVGLTHEQLRRLLNSQGMEQELIDR